MSKILLVDDDRDILDLLRYNLVKEGFDVYCVDSSHEAIAIAKDFNPDLIILDIMMPHPNGIELCRELRSLEQFENTYIFFLTAKSESYYQQAAFETGGDDFIEKIIGLRALTCKVRSVLKRKFQIRKSVNELRLGKLIIRRKSNSVHIGNKEIVLSKPEFELLFFFAQNPQKSISQENLLHNIWGSEVYLLDSSVDIYINNLRHKLGLNWIHQTKDKEYQLNPL